MSLFSFFKFIIYMFIFIFIPAVLFSQHHDKIKKYNILFVSPFSEIGDWENDFNHTLHLEVNSQSDIEIGISHHHLSSKITAKNEDEIVTCLVSVIDTTGADLVIILFPALHDLFIRNNDHFNTDLVKIFLPAIEPQLDSIKLIENAYAIKSSSQYAMSETLHMIKKLIPNLKSLYVISGSNDSDLPYLYQFKNILKQNQVSDTTTFLVGENFNELLKKISILPENSAIFLLPMNEDKENNILSGNELFPAFSDAASAPVFTFTDSFLKFGIVGGNLTNPKAYAKDAAEIVLQIAQGGIPNKTEDQDISTYMFNWEAIKKWNLNPSLLPASSVIINRHYSFLELYWKEVIFGMLIIVIQSLMIILLIVAFIKRKQINTLLLKTVKTKELLLHEIHHRVKNNMAVILGLIEMQSFKKKHGDFKDSMLAIRNRIYAMATIHEQLYSGPDKSDRPELEVFFRKLADNITSSYHHHVDSISLNINAEEHKLSMGLLVNLSIIINEILTNSMKHAFSNVKFPEINILFRYSPDEKNYYLKICDNGKGFEDQKSAALENSDSLGMIIINSLVDQINGTIHRENKNGACTIIKFQDVHL